MPVHPLIKYEKRIGMRSRNRLRNGKKVFADIGKKWNKNGPNLLNYFAAEIRADSRMSGAKFFRQFIEAARIDPYLEDVVRVSARVSKYSRAVRDSLLKWVLEILRDSKLCKSDRHRVGAVKTLVALLPSSEEAIRALLIPNQDAAVAEIQFTLFCFLDRLPELAGGRALASDVPRLVEEYLLKIRSRAALAPWMASDLLGDHWKVSEALPVLSHVATQGRFVAGRAGALHGLEMLIPRCGLRRNGRIKQILREVAHNDPSPSVRNLANMILGTDEPKRDAGHARRASSQTKVMRAAAGNGSSRNG
jgi:hypothetical protein